MLSKEEIENSKRSLKRVLETDPLIATVDFQYIDVDNLLEYTNQLESDKQKLIEKIESNIKRINSGKILRTRSILKEILEILKGEKDEQGYRNKV